MVLSADGVRYSARFTGAADSVDLTVSRDEISGSGFRRGPAGFLWFCLDAPVPIPAPGELERAPGPAAADHGHPPDGKRLDRLSLHRR
jgi:hypothetical protein